MVPVCSTAASRSTEKRERMAACSQLRRAAGWDATGPVPVAYDAAMTWPWRLTRTVMVMVPVCVPAGFSHEESVRPLRFVPGVPLNAPDDALPSGEPVLPLACVDPGFVPPKLTRELMRSAASFCLRSLSC